MVCFDIFERYFTHILQLVFSRFIDEEINESRTEPIALFDPYKNEWYSDKQDIERFASFAY